LEKIEYRNWPNCYRISNGLISLVVNADAGGRIMVFERDGINLIYENPEQDGLLLEDFLKLGFDPDGGRFDYGQERQTQDKHSLTFMGKWQAEILSEHYLKLTSAPDYALGILSTRTFELDPKSPCLRIIQTMKNISSKPSNYFFWGRTLVKPEGKLIMPVNPESNIPGYWGRYIWGDPEQFLIDENDKGVSLKDGIFSLIPLNAENEKYGTDSMDGWMAYGYKSILFVKKYDFQPKAEYGELYGLTNIFYTNKRFAEMEPVSALAHLSPEEEISYAEDWYLLDYPECKSNDFDAKDCSEYLLKMIKDIKEK